jgi:hypothetical protein
MRYHYLKVSHSRAAARQFRYEERRGRTRRRMREALIWD